MYIRDKDFEVLSSMVDLVFKERAEHFETLKLHAEAFKRVLQLEELLRKNGIDIPEWDEEEINDSEV